MSSEAPLRSIAPLYRSPAQTLERLNQTLTEVLSTGEFVTMVYGILDAGSRQITVASAEHFRDPMPVSKAPSPKGKATDPDQPTPAIPPPSCSLTIKQVGWLAALGVPSIGEGSANREVAAGELSQPFHIPPLCDLHKDGCPFVTSSAGRTVKE